MLIAAHPGTLDSKAKAAAWGLALLLCQAVCLADLSYWIFWQRLRLRLLGSISAPSFLDEASRHALLPRLGYMACLGMPTILCADL